MPSPEHAPILIAYAMAFGLYWLVCWFAGWIMKA